MRTVGLSLALLAAGGMLTACSSSKPSSSTASADKLVAQGLRAQNAGNVTAAVSDYQAALKANPLDYVAYYDLGVIDQQRHDTGDAAANYQKAVLINPKYKPALFNLAILESSTSPLQAVSLYEQLNSFDAHDPNVLLNLGLLLRGLGQTAAGNADVAEAVRLNPSLASRVPPTAPTAPTTPTTPATATTPTTAPAAHR